MIPDPRAPRVRSSGRRIQDITRHSVNFSFAWRAPRTPEGCRFAAAGHNNVRQRQLVCGLSDVVRPSFEGWEIVGGCARRTSMLYVVAAKRCLTLRRGRPLARQRLASKATTPRQAHTSLNLIVRRGAISSSWLLVAAFSILLPFTVISGIRVS